MENSIRHKAITETPFINEIVSDLFTTEDTLVNAEVFELEEMDEKTCQYIHLQQNRNLSALRKKSSLDIELDFHAPLAFLLGDTHEKLSHNHGLKMGSLYVQKNQDNTFRFCISGSISLEDLKKLSEHCQNHPPSNKM